MIHCTYQKHPTHIGNNVSIGHNAIVHGCTLRDNVLIGMGAIVMENCITNNPLGVKGVGELGTIGDTPAVVNAVVDALALAGLGRDAERIQMPVTAERVWRALHLRQFDPAPLADLKS